MRPLPRLFVLLLLFASLPAQTPPDLREHIEQFAADVADLERRYDVPMSDEHRRRLGERFDQELRELAALDFDALPADARIDWILQDNHVRRQQHRLEQEARRDAEVREVLPFAALITGLGEARRRLEPVDPQAAAATVAELERSVEQVRTQLRDGKLDAVAPPIAVRTADRLGELRDLLRDWFEYRCGYDPQFSWWLRAPFGAADTALGALQQELQDHNTGKGGDSSLVGDPIGEAALLQELAFEFVPYTPPELIAIAEREFAWCDAELVRAAREMGCGDDWKQALAKVKDDHRAPGGQPQLIKELAEEAIAFVEQRDLVTIPPLAKECWRMRMMSPAQQRVSPYFLGGETIQVSFPTEQMSHADKLQSLRSNNEHFCRATVHHELIPGHWLQQYSQERYRRYRAPFGTPFWIEGWSLYWEMRLYDLGLAHDAADRIGMLYWRTHRCARIVFSLHFHLGDWTGPQCVDYLVERVGHERAAAEAEVRRSVGGGYGPLYQAAYMLGGLQLRALHRELVVSGRFTEKAFHDGVLRQNSIPIAVVRAALAAEPPPRELPRWRFADE